MEEKVGAGWNQGKFDGSNFNYAYHVTFRI